MKLRFIELFAGIGGFRLGLERAGHAAVWANEILEIPRHIYEQNFGDKPDPRDIRTIDPADIPRHDLLTAGFPCATFSIAGKRSGFTDADIRGTLFFEICRVLRHTRSRYVLLENVKGLTNHDGGQTFGVILTQLDELGYDLQWQVLNSRDFGVPQARERVFIVGNLRGTPRPKIFPLRNTTVAARGRTGGDTRGIVVRPVRHGRPEQRIAVREATTRGYAEVNEGDGVNLAYPESETRRGRVIKGAAHTLMANGVNGVFQDGRLRRLTPVECERLQGLPDGFTRVEINSRFLGERERYERCGRTVTIPIIEEIGRGFYDHY